MSADFFRSEQHGMENFNEQINNNEEGSGDRSGKKTNDIRLQDIEEQLEMAESRCNNLKNQLDYMKQVYGVGRNAPPKSRKISNVKDRTSDILDESTTSIDENSKNIPLRSTTVSRQTSNAISTDNTGAAVRTINNILNGITNSVNRLSEIHSQIATPRIKVSTAVDSKNSQNQEEFRRSEREVVGIVPEIKIESSEALTSKLRGQKRKAKSGKTASQLTIKKASRIEKKIKSALSKSSGILEKHSSTVMRNRFLNKLNTKNNHLVEIYHNDAVKHSDSDDSNLKKSRQQNERKSGGDNKEVDGVPPLNIQALNYDGPRPQSARTDQTYQNGVSNQYSYDPPEAPRTTVSCCYSKNYELPTVASRMKQVAKSYLGNLNLKTIPFCAAISTTQSHNIGINIQQVMNIIKNRQPINGISPTLAHNIGLAAEKLNSKPFSTLISTINSRIAQTASKCPLSKAYLNIQQLQEQAKNVPDDTIEEGDEETADSPKTQTMLITGPSGDMEIKTKNTPLWSIDKNVNNEQCTCITQNTGGFPHVDRKHQRNNRSFTENTVNSQMTDNNRLKTRLRRYRTTRNHYIVKSATPQQTQAQTVNPSPINQETQKEDPIKGREKNLKEVLTNLHSDFESLNQKYEDLSEKSVGGGNEETIKELERLEIELTKKEEEITMVMSLYKEVLALKQQVKQLKEKRSQASIPPKETKNTKLKFEEYNNPEAAFHLTKLLRQIQHYQMRYKSNLSEE